VNRDPLQVEMLELRILPNVATIDWNAVHQQIAGFGASSAWTLPTMTTAQANLFFSQTNGIGLSLLRSQISDTSTSGTSNEVKTMQMAQALGATVWSTPWSPPAQWKSNGDIANGGYLLPQYYQDYANLLTNYVLNMKADGISIYAVSIQNEPNISAGYDSCTWTAQQIHDFVTILGPTFARHGVTAKIMLPEENGWHFELASATLEDPNTAKYVGIVAGHDYDGGDSAVPQANGYQLWETEVSDSGPFDPSMASGLRYADEIYYFMTVAQANAWNYWWLQSGNSDNEGLLGPTGEMTKRLYTLGNYSKFVRPGDYRIGTTEDGGVLISAYKNINTGQFVFVVVNTGGATTETFNLNGFSASTATPWVTSFSLNLAQQADVIVNGSSFTYTLAAGSVTTFVGTAGARSAPAAPTGLAATAGNSQVALTWNAAANAASYNIYRSTVKGGAGTTPYMTGVTSTSFTDTRAAAGTTYYYQVTAVSAGAEGARSSEVSATPQVPAPRAPTGLSATAGDAQVTLSWAVSSGAASYNIYRSTTSGGEGTPLMTGVTATSFTDTGLTDGTTYYYEVTAVNAGGESGKSSEVSAALAMPVHGGPGGWWIRCDSGGRGDRGWVRRTRLAAEFAVWRSRLVPTHLTAHYFNVQRQNLGDLFGGHLQNL
jgi:glucuronoarabinoxylan endo-1,4-beta-xylanase